MDGERRRLDDFDAVIVHARECSTPSCPIETSKFLPPLLIEEKDRGLAVTAGNRARIFAPGQVERVTVRKLAPDRTAIVAGVAVGLAVLAGYLTYRGVGGCEEGSNDSGEGGPLTCAGLFFGLPAAAAAGSLSLLVTLPLTKPLGSLVE